MTRRERTTKVDDAKIGVVDALKTLRAALNPVDESPEDTALCTIETFCDVALRVIRASNPSKVREAARNVEMRAHLDGIEVRRM